MSRRADTGELFFLYTRFTSGVNMTGGGGGGVKLFRLTNRGCDTVLSHVYYILDLPPG